jgi:inorganic pyrophosphatase
LGSKHPDFTNIYPVNYGFIPHTYSPVDQEEIDAYVLGPKEPLAMFIGTVIAVIKRTDGEIKLVVTAGQDYSIEEIRKLTNFAEKYHQSVIIK